MHNQQLIFVFWRRPKIERKKKETYRRFGEVKPFVLIGITTYTETAWICLWEDDLWNDSTAIGSPAECRYIRINIWIAFFSIKNNIYFVCEFWDHCIYESPHISSMAAWRWFNMARRGTQHWSLPTVWGKVSSRLALYAGKPPSSFMTLSFYFLCVYHSVLGVSVWRLFLFTQ